MDRHMITLEGYKDLAARIDYYTNTRLYEALQEVSEGMADHDFREDSRVVVAMEEKNRIQEKIAELQTLINSADIVHNTESNEYVSFGMYAHIKNLETQSESLIIYLY